MSDAERLAALEARLDGLTGKHDALVRENAHLQSEVAVVMGMVGHLLGLTSTPLHDSIRQILAQHRSEYAEKVGAAVHPAERAAYQGGVAACTALISILDQNG